jgi:predicted transcriptional regulator
MTSPAVTINEDRPLREAAALMVDLGINRLPVVADGRLVGMLSRADMVRAYLRLDDEIEHAVREEVLRQTMWLDPGSFDIDVREGIVRISGKVDRRSTARIIEKLVGLVDGVSAVEASLKWEFDDTDVRASVETEPEPGAASVTARKRPPSLHR